MSSPPDRVPFGLIGFGGVALGGALLLVLGAPRDRSTPRVAPTPVPVQVSANGVTLTAASADLPTDDVALPPGPNQALVEANCTACHSAGMIASQPPLRREQWEATVEKMQKVYRAPIEEKAVPAILDYLEGLGAPPPQP